MSITVKTWFNSLSIHRKALLIVLAIWLALFLSAAIVTFVPFAGYVMVGVAFFGFVSFLLYILTLLCLEGDGGF